MALLGILLISHFGNRCVWKMYNLEIIEEARLKL